MDRPAPAVPSHLIGHPFRTQALVKTRKKWKKFRVDLDTGAATNVISIDFVDRFEPKGIILPTDFPEFKLVNGSKPSSKFDVVAKKRMAYELTFRLKDSEGCSREYVMWFLAIDRPPRAPLLLISNPAIKEIEINLYYGD